MSTLGQAAKMVQPNEGSGSSYAAPLCAGGSGDMSLGKPEAIPPEVCNHEAFLRLRAENQDLRVALEQSNSMLRKRHSEMLEFQETQRREREFIAFKFSEAKNLVLRLTKERDSLQGQLEEAKKHLAGMTATEHEPTKEGQLEDLQRTMDANLKLENGKFQITDSAVTNGVRMREPEVLKIQTEVNVLQGAGERNSRAEQDLQEKLQEAEKQNTQLHEQIQELKEEVSQLTHHLTEQAEDAHRKLQLLAEEKMSVKAQVTSLLGELHESQRSLEVSTQERRKTEESLRSVREQQREGEAQIKQQVLQLDQHRMQVQNLEAALKMERQNAREEMRKLSQLQSAYHKLFQEYDLHMKNSLHQEKLMTSLEVEVRELRQQLQEAEEALVAKQELIDKLKVETDEQKGLKETVGVLKAQAEIYCADFHAEREARARLHTEKQKLQEQLDELLRERLRNESGGARARMEDMMKRHSDTLHPSMHGAYQAAYPTPPPPSIHPLVEQQEYCCPKCQYKAPDIDTLQIHVMDCIQ
ncbi:NF-kappa-B essential modulator isoform X3 [Hyla sarda]|uniref:NF-kappa-B essential modulator isoform X3 n=1 Tax=Hyla sarda TaxID=327740 RepID=UPI0024C27B63|nr:NF-kappa-B essential modulator isoform X3 [Hyla sarda]